MKSSFSILALVMAVSAQANTVQTVYKPDSVLPMQLRADILTYIESHCAEYTTPYGMNELESKVADSFYDFSYSEIHYVTKISSMNYDGDGMHPEWADIVVHSSKSNDGEGGVLYMVDSVTVNDSPCK